jgi:hypothetical protein
MVLLVKGQSFGIKEVSKIWKEAICTFNITILGFRRGGRLLGLFLRNILKIQKQKQQLLLLAFVIIT